MRAWTLGWILTGCGWFGASEPESTPFDQLVLTAPPDGGRPAFQLSVLVPAEASETELSPAAVFPALVETLSGPLATCHPRVAPEDRGEWFLEAVVRLDGRGGGMLVPPRVPDPVASCLVVEARKAPALGFPELELALPIGLRLLDEGDVTAPEAGEAADAPVLIPGAAASEDGAMPQPVDPTP